MNDLRPGDFIWLNIRDLSLSSSPNGQINSRKDKIALCAYPERDLFFLVNTKFYPWAADGMLELLPSDLCMLKYSSWLNLASLHVATNDDYELSDLSHRFRLTNEQQYKTIFYRISKCSTIERKIKNDICQLWEDFFGKC